MEFIDTAAECDDSDSNSSLSDEDSDSLADFIVDNQDQQESLSFYRDEHVFENQIRPIEECEDSQPYLYEGDFTSSEVHSFSDDKCRAEEF